MLMHLLLRSLSLLLLLSSLQLLRGLQSSALHLRIVSKLLLLLQPDLFLTQRLWRERWLLLHASSLQHVCPFPARTSMTMLEVLSEVIGTEELLALVALAELVHDGQVLTASNPVGGRIVGELETAIATDVVLGVGAWLTCLRMVGVGMRRDSSAGMEDGFVGAVQGGTRPRVEAQVEGVLMTFSFVLILEAVVAVLAVILLLGLMMTMNGRC